MNPFTDPITVSHYLAVGAVLFFALATIGAVSGSANTALVIASPSTVDATAPWFPVQNGHWFRYEV